MTMSVNASTFDKKTAVSQTANDFMRKSGALLRRPGSEIAIPYATTVRIADKCNISARIQTPKVEQNCRIIEAGAASANCETNEATLASATPKATLPITLAA